MPIEHLKIRGRRVWKHKGVITPDFHSEHVLSRDPWLYVELWLKRRKATEATAYWSQAKRFAEAAEGLPIEAAPLPLYYAFLNATKALLATKGNTNSARLGVGGLRPENAKTMLANETVNFQSGGVLPSLCDYFGESSAKSSYTLKDILWNIPFIHRAFRLTFTSADELFIPLERARYVKKVGTTEVYFEAEIIPRFSDMRVLSNLPSSLEIFDDKDKKKIRRKKCVKWATTRANAQTKEQAISRLSHYHSQTRRIVVNISGNRDLWYVKRHRDTNSVGMRHTIVLMFAAMHRLSELSRYDPGGLDKHLSGQANWLLSEFITGAIDQFVDQIASEITGCQFWPPKVR